MQIIDNQPQLVFDSFYTLSVIESDSILTEIFLDGVSNLTMDKIKNLLSSNTLPDEIKERLNNIFLEIICKNRAPYDQYVKISSGQIEMKNENKSTDNNIPTKKNRKLPKHYGKKRILEDVQSNNQVTELDRAMLALNTLRNIYTKLKNRGIKDKTNKTNILSDSDCRDIIATVRIVENKVNNILKKK